jgi:pimeloyl-ACP methyl ester carboxylesterase
VRLSHPVEPGGFIDYTLSHPPGGTCRGVVVYVHGFSSNQQGGGKAGALAARCREMGFAFLAFDHRGHGASSGSMQDMTVTRNVEDLDAVLSALAGSFEQCMLVGSSMGAQTAAWYAAAHPERVTACALLAPGFSFLKDQLDGLDATQLAALESQGSVRMRTRSASAPAAAGVECTLGLELQRDLERHTVDALLARYRTPTLLVHGLQDDWVPWTGSVDFARRSAARPLELLLIAGADHGLREHEAEVLDAVCGFLARVSARFENHQGFKSVQGLNPISR